LLAEYFSWEGLDVLTAMTTDDAIAIADRADVVITALQVRGSVDGIGLIRKLRADRRACRIIVYTTCGFPQFDRAARAAGCDEFFVKPCRLDVLVAAVRAPSGRRTALPSQLPQPGAAKAAS
jgi:DNA-binding response OmpR family regulator